MLRTITTTHAIPQALPSGGCQQVTTVRCCYCLEILGEALDMKSKAQILKAHHCKAKRLIRKPAASVPYN